MALKIQPTAGEQDPGSLTLVCSIQETLYHKDRVVTGDPEEQGVALPSANTHSKIRVHQGVQSHKSRNRLVSSKPRQRARHNPSSHNIKWLKEVTRAGPRCLFPTPTSKTQLWIGPKSASGEHCRRKVPKGALLTGIVLGLTTPLPGYTHNHISA